MSTCGTRGERRAAAPGSRTRSRRPSAPLSAIGVTLISLLLLLPLAMVAGATPAAAHADLISTTPEEGAVLDTVPAGVTLTFSDPVLPDTVVVSVEDDTGFVVRVLDLDVAGGEVSASWPPGMRGTEYSVNYRVVSDDGHPVEGTLHFSVRTPPAPPATAAPSSPVTAPAVPEASDTTSQEAADQGSLLLPVLAALAVGLVVGLVVLALSRRTSRRRADSSPPQ